MSGERNDDTMRAGEVAVELPASTDAGVYFIGTIHTPWRVRSECPKRGSEDGPICSIIVDPRWRDALTDIMQHRRIQVLYWMHHARRDLVLQTPSRTGQTTGSFALRSPVRPNRELMISRSCLACGNRATDMISACLARPSATCPAN